MSGSIVQHPAWAAVLGLLCGVVGFRVGWRAARRWALPIVQAVLGGIAFVAAWSADGPAHAAVAVGAWAVGTTLASLPVFVRAPFETDQRVLRARTYRAEMLEWLETGRGPESRPLRMIARHALELAVYVGAGVLSMNLLAIAMGAMLLNYMNAWVAALWRAARQPSTVAALGWNPWSVVRLAAYVLVGVATAWPWASRTPLAVPWTVVAPLAIAGAVGIGLDVALKLVLSRPCGRILAAAVDLAELAATPDDDEVVPV